MAVKLACRIFILSMVSLSTDATAKAILSFFDQGPQLVPLLFI